MLSASAASATATALPQNKFCWKQILPRTNLAENKFCREQIFAEKKFRCPKPRRHELSYATSLKKNGRAASATQ